MLRTEEGKEGKREKELLKSPGRTTYNAKTNIVVGFARIVVVAIGRTAVLWIVVPATAALPGLPPVGRLALIGFD